MNVYDFDGTLYDGDCMVDFYKYCLKKRPYIVVCFPWQFTGWWLHRRGKLDIRSMKQRYYKFFKYVDVEKMSQKFWDCHMDRIFPWYLQQQKDDDIVISASPEFHIREACSRLGIKYFIASQVDTSTGRCLGPNCRDEEKVRRFREIYGDVEVEEFYSDEDHDRPMAEIADKAYKVKDGVVTEWILRS